MICFIGLSLCQLGGIAAAEDSTDHPGGMQTSTRSAAIWRLLQLVLVQGFCLFDLCSAVIQELIRLPTDRGSKGLGNVVTPTHQGLAEVSKDSPFSLVGSREGKKVPQWVSVSTELMDGGKDCERGCLSLLWISLLSLGVTVIHSGPSGPACISPPPQSI